jgi:hypothetical protein
MKLQLVGAVRDERGRHEPGTVVAFDDGEAHRLIALGVAVAYVAEQQEADYEPQEAAAQPKRKKRK